MPAAPKNAMNAVLGEELLAIKEAGHFRVAALADTRGLAWATAGEILVPDHLAAVPSLVARAFNDRQPLLRFFSQQSMRFEYHSDCLAYIQRSIDGEAPGASFLLDVPQDKESQEFVVAWGENEYLVIRHFMVRDEAWCLVGIGSNPTEGRKAMRQATDGIAERLSTLSGPYGPPVDSPDQQHTLRERMVAVLESLREAVPGIQMSAVTSKDGFVVAAMEGGTMDADLVAPLMGHSYLAIEESTQRLCGATESVMLRMEHGILLAREVADDLLFAALLDPSACTGLVLSAFETSAMALRDALESLSSPMTAPKGCEVAA
jgi:predicted regulator of Ras-like GTPase activity (Roadblock/LC7/MglB family)